MGNNRTVHFAMFLRPTTSVARLRVKVRATSNVAEGRLFGTGSSNSGSPDGSFGVAGRAGAIVSNLALPSRLGFRLTS